MAICLRSIKNYGFLLSISRRNQRINIINREVIPSIVIRFLKEVTDHHYSLFSTHYNLSLNMLESVQIPPSDLILRNNIYPDCNTKALYCEDYLNLHCLRIKDNSVYCGEESKEQKADKKLDECLRKGSPEQVQHVLTMLSRDIPDFFVKPMNYSIYHQNVVFENHIKDKKTVGIFLYAKQMALLKTVGHLKFATVKMEVLKITSHPEDGTVRVRWRIVGVSNYRAFFSFLNVGPKMEESNWYDGFSIFYVMSDGLIHKHIVDKLRWWHNEMKRTVCGSFLTKRNSLTGMPWHQCSLCISANLNFKKSGLILTWWHLTHQNVAQGWANTSSRMFVQIERNMMMPDSDEKPIASVRNNLAAKMAFAIGVCIQ